MDHILPTIGIGISQTASTKFGSSNFRVLCIQQAVTPFNITDTHTHCGAVTSEKPNCNGIFATHGQGGVNQSLSVSLSLSFTHTHTL